MLTFLSVQFDPDGDTVFLAICLDVISVGVFISWLHGTL